MEYAIHIEFKATTNEAKYEALLTGLRVAIEIGVESLKMEYAIHIEFKATTNEVEYEALLTGLRVAIEMGVESLNIYSDSQLVVNQV